MIFQEEKEFSYQTVLLALRMGDQFLAGVIYFTNVVSYLIRVPVSFPKHIGKDSVVKPE